MRGLVKHVPLDEIPETESLFSGADLEEHLRKLDGKTLSLVAVGDIMLGGRSRKFINEFGPGYVFEGVRPLLKLAPIGLANLEGPIAREAEKLDRNYSYRVKPKLSGAMLKAGINVVTLANNHLLDCGREGVLETLHALKEIGVAAIGAGEKVAEVFWGPAFGGAIEDWFAYMLALAFLLFRPQGLFGERIIERV